MSTRTATAATQSPCSAEQLAEKEIVSVERLITNRPLKFPIYDTNGLLLLAEGSLITVKFKELLRARNIVEVLLHESDVQSATLSKPAAEGDKPTIEFDSELTADLDRIIESGNLLVTITGHSLDSQLVRHGKQGYSNENRQRLAEVQGQATATLTQCMERAVRGQAVDGKQVCHSIGEMLSVMMADVDCVLNVLSDVGEDTALADHCVQLAMLGMALGVEIGLDDENTRALGLCGLLHDWGMALVPREIAKSDKLLSEAEFMPIKRHPIIALDMLQKISGLPPTVALGAYQVHERCDGSGYPRGRRQSQIHLFARILGVADAYLALTSPRPYRPALMPYAAMECLVTQASLGHYDPKVIRALLHVMGLFPIGSYVVLSDVSTARVLRRSGDDYSKPIVRALTRTDGTEVADDEPDAIRNLAESAEWHVVQAPPTPGQRQIALSTEFVTPQRPQVEA